MIECKLTYKADAISDALIEIAIWVPCLPVEGSFIRFGTECGVDCYGKVQAIVFFPVQEQGNRRVPSVTIALGQVLPAEHFLMEMKARGLT